MDTDISPWGVEQFQRALSALPEPPADRPPFWNYWRHDLWSRAESDPHDFMSWPCIYHTMLVNHFPMNSQFDALNQSWTRWEAVVRAPVVGRPMDWWPVRPYSRNMVEQAYHLKLWEDTTDKRIEELSNIVEIGGGFGAMALAVHRLGFQGRYCIIDLPEFVILQTWFLSQHGLAVEHWTGTPTSAPMTGDPTSWGVKTCDLLVAVYSLSETDLDFRDLVTTRVQAHAHLLLYSDRFGLYDNRAYFTRFMDQRPNHLWNEAFVPDRPDRYALGWLDTGSGEKN